MNQGREDQATQAEQHVPGNSRLNAGILDGRVIDPQSKEKRNGDNRGAGHAEREKNPGHGVLSSVVVRGDTELRIQTGRHLRPSD